MAMKREALEKRKQERVDASVQIGLSQLALPGMSLMSLLQFGSDLLLKEAISAEITSYLGRKHYQHSTEGEAFKGHRNGHQRSTIDTLIGALEYDRPKIAYAPDFKSQFHLPYMRRPDEFAQAVTDMYINGTSTRKVKDCLKAVPPVSGNVAVNVWEIKT